MFQALLCPSSKARGNQHYSRELLMMGIVVPEKCSAYKKYNKIMSGIKLVFSLHLIAFLPVLIF